MTSLLGIAGSIRSAAFSKTILQTLAESVSAPTKMTVFALDDIPLYNQDLDTETPPAAVAALRKAIGDADGIVIATPEYNHGMSGVLKNALDWASRPVGKATLTGKPVLTLSSSPGAVGGARAQAQLNETLAAIGARTVLRPQSVVGAVHTKISDGKLTDAATIKFLLAGIDDLIRDIAIAGVVAKESD